jgi:hypothetical protein
MYQPGVAELIAGQRRAAMIAEASANRLARPARRLTMLPRAIGFARRGRLALPAARPTLVELTEAHRRVFGERRKAALPVAVERRTGADRRAMHA